jgi:hypothetical protein
MRTLPLKLQGQPGARRQATSNQAMPKDSRAGTRVAPRRPALLEWKGTVPLSSERVGAAPRMGAAVAFATPMLASLVDRQYASSPPGRRLRDLCSRGVRNHDELIGAQTDFGLLRRICGSVIKDSERFWPLVLNKKHNDEACGSLCKTVLWFCKDLWARSVRPQVWQLPHARRRE